MIPEAANETADLGGLTQQSVLGFRFDVVLSPTPECVGPPLSVFQTGDLKHRASGASEQGQSEARGSRSGAHGPRLQATAVAAAHGVGQNE